MAKNKKKSKGKKHQSIFTLPVAPLGKKGYFESDRLPKLPIDGCFISRSTSEELDYIHVAITRRHTNGNLSFGFFGMPQPYGELYEVMYDFNISQDKFDEFAAYVELEPFDDLMAIEQLIIDAVLISKTSGFKTPADLHIAGRILSEKLSPWHEISQVKLAPFQIEDQPEAIDEKISHQQEQHATNASEIYTATIYEPEKVRHWGKSDWETFVLEFEQFNKMDFFEKGLTPLCYLFEKNMLQDYPIDASLQKALSRLAGLQTQLTNQRTPDTHKPSSYEILMEKGLDWAMDEGQHTKTSLSTLLELTQKYPDNPVFYRQLFDIYDQTENSDALLTTAIDTYQRFPLMGFAFINYFKTMFYQNQEKMIESFFNKGYLIEDHFPKEFVFHDLHYHFYYLVLGNYLAVNSQYGALLMLYKIIAQTEYFKNSPLIQKGWQGTLADPISVICSKLIASDHTERECIINTALSGTN